MGVKICFENHSKTRSESKKETVGEVEVVILSRRIISASIENEVKKTTVDRFQFISNLPQKTLRNVIRT